MFAAEAALKIISMGFVLSKGSYLRDAWNILDFTVVVAAYVMSHDSNFDCICFATQCVRALSAALGGSFALWHIASRFCGAGLATAGSRS